MPLTKFEIRELPGGIKSLRLIENQETFHPDIGPMAEARILHVDQHNILERAAAKGSFVLWDVGLGAAANAIAALDLMKSSSCPMTIHSFDRNTDALVFALANDEDLDYIKPYRLELELLLADGRVQIGSVDWHFHLGDFADTMKDENISPPDSLFYDPYSPRGNVDMWTLDHFTALRKRLKNPCLFSNYTRATSTRVTWLLAGFFVGIGVAIGKKEESSLGATDLSLLEKPLQKTWLKRVEVSHSGAPLRGPLYAMQKIEPEDLATLRAHPQFADFIC